MGTLELSRSIAASPEQVFVFFVPQRMAYWYGAEMGGRFEVQNGAADFSPGLKVRISGRLGKMAVSLIAEVEEYERPRALEWRFEDDYGVSGTERWDLSREDSHTVVRFASRYRIPGLLGRLLDSLLTRRALARRHAGYLARLARLVEHGDESGGAGALG